MRPVIPSRRTSLVITENVGHSPLWRCVNGSLIPPARRQQGTAGHAGRAGPFPLPTRQGGRDGQVGFFECFGLSSGATPHCATLRHAGRLLVPIVWAKASAEALPPERHRRFIVVDGKVAVPGDDTARSSRVVSSTSTASRAPSRLDKEHCYDVRVAAVVG